MQPFHSSVQNLKLVHLRSLLTLLGGQISGTKSQLQKRVFDELNVAKLALHARKRGSNSAPIRLLSIDMGIRNLAFCVCDIDLPATSPDTTAVPKVTLYAWHRISLLPPEPEGEIPPTASENFSPPALSRTALNLLTSTLLPYAPDTILIERQRFRTGGASAVQEWTLRVNMLESMMWAILTTLKTIQGGGPLQSSPSWEIWPVNPRQVAQFFVADIVGISDGKKSKSKAERGKAEKIAVAAALIAGQERREIKLTIGDGVQSLVGSFLAKLTTKTKRQAAPRQAHATPTSVLEDLEKPSEIGKLDDLADCLLQASAWVTWERNRRELLKLQKAGIHYEALVEWIGRRK
ncbi:Ydc2-catalyt-domain-containing protein [Trichodelitschia bisporula]|uniref:Ydc2-catalyt-domain-containing protein n=1 Tax=Trichodelitschia bisporula TaxID=703511 RepID=A0A6G1HTH7_9PEZI|nr:Ydc2-catalyt-domain-containing protein [Trichodelitschia bisporula]